MSISEIDLAAVRAGAEHVASMEFHSIPGYIIAQAFQIDLGRQTGKRILDVAAGGSNLVALLRESGALAWGLDPAYEDIDAAVQQGQEVVDRHKSGVKMGEAFEMAVNSAARDHNQQFAGGSLEQFVADASEHPEHYIVGSALELPFEADDLDRVTMHGFISTMREPNADFTTAVVKEAIRPLRRSGIFNIGTFMIDSHPSVENLAATRQQIKADVLSAVEVAGAEHRMKLSSAQFTVAKGLTTLAITRKK